VVKVWDVDTGNCMATFTFDDGVRCCAVIGSLIIAGGEGERVHLLALEQ